MSMRQRRQQTLFGTAFSTIAAGVLLLGATTVSGQDRQRDEGWSDEVWRSAMAGSDLAVVSGLRTVPAVANLPGRDALSTSRDQFFDHLDAQIESRNTEFSEAMDELRANFEAGKLSEALGNALAAHEMALDDTEMLAAYSPDALMSRDDLLVQPDVIRLISRSVDAARNAESAGDLLKAQDLFYRLNTLLSDTEPYTKDLERVSRRVGLLRFYYPSRLHELNNERLIGMGEEPRPLYEDDALAWHEKLINIDRGMVVEMLSVSATNHLRQQGWAPLLSGGFESIDTLLTTADLADVFPGMSNEEDVKALLGYVQREADRWRIGGGGDRLTTSGLLRRLLRENERTVGLPDSVILHEFGEGAIGSLDKFSDFIWPYEMDMFRRQLDGSFTGVGIQITLDDANRLKIVTPLEDTPGFHAGLKAGDKIIQVDGKSTLGISLSQAVDQITGRRGSEVELTIEREGETKPLSYTIRRDRIKINSVKGWRNLGGGEWDYLIDPQRGIGYVRLTGFLPDTVPDFDDAIMTMKAQGARSVILDLRFNPGGQLTPSVEICNRFISEGDLVSTRGMNDQIIERPRRAQRHLAAALSDFPVVALINEGSASASEIVSGCLQDHQRALIVGTRSYGKGSVQKVRAVARGDALVRVTTEYYVLPSGSIIHREPGSTAWGVEPDLKVRMTPEQVATALRLRQEADIPAENGEDNVDPSQLLAEGIDLQLEAAVLLLQARTVSEQPVVVVQRPEKRQ